MPVDMSTLRHFIFLLMILALSGAVPVACALGNYTVPVSDYQNATISVDSDVSMGLLEIGRYGNGTVYIGGGAGATLREGCIDLSIEAADEMGYRDVYLFYPVSANFERISFDYNLSSGDKSNVLLFDTMATLPDVQRFKGGFKDRSIVGMGVWSSRYGEIGGLKPMPEGVHHAEAFVYQGELILYVDGRYVDSSGFTPQKYLTLHFMTGDGESYLKGRISGLSVNESAAVNMTPVSPSPTRAPSIAAGKNSGDNSGGAGATGLNDSSDNASGDDAGRKSSGMSLWLAVLMGAGFFLAWGIIYIKYVRRE